MARRDRTTGLPRPRPHQTGPAAKTVMGIPMTERSGRFAILGGAVALLVVVLALSGWYLYDTNYRTPNSAVLSVEGDDYSLSYYTDRLYSFARENTDTTGNLPLTEQALLQKLEEEAITLKLAQQKGITITEQDITNQIGVDLGVPVGNVGSAFDRLYRAKLEETHMSDESYRRLTKAKIANDRLVLKFEEEVGATAELLTIRAVVSNTMETSQAIAARIDKGEDMGTIAQKESTDSTSRQQDGLIPPTPLELLPDAVRELVARNPDGKLLGPVEASGSYWVLRVERRDPQGELSASAKTSLAQSRLDAAIAALRTSSKIKRSLDTKDLKWAEDKIASYPSPSSQITTK